uniref:Uncharacterized protein n=1 Tax=Arundo donax TaxID=35708 RepID=A0A0A9HWH5_ARUDO
MPGATYRRAYVQVVKPIGARARVIQRAAVCSRADRAPTQAVARRTAPVRNKKEFEVGTERVGVSRTARPRPGPSEPWSFSAPAGIRRGHAREPHRISWACTVVFFSRIACRRAPVLHSLACNS